MIKEKDKEDLQRYKQTLGNKGGGGERQRTEERGGHGGQKREQEYRGREENEVIKAIESEPLTPSNLVKWAEGLGRILVDRGLKSAKLRRIYDPVTVLKARLRAIVSKGEEEREKELENVRASLLFLKPKLRSESRRERGVEPLGLALEAYINRVINSRDIKDYENFINFFEAIVGYHKGFGGRD